MKKEDLEKVIQENERTIRNTPIIPIKGEEGFYKSQTLETLMGKSFPEVPWLIHNLISENSIVFLSGAPGQYKTWIGLHLALSAAKGQPAFGSFKCTQPMGVMILDEENSDRRLQTRLKLMEKEWKLPLFFRIGERLNLEDGEEAIKELISDCLALNVRLAVFDSFVRFFPHLDENSAKDTNKAYQQIRKINDAGIATLFIHHNRKQGILKVKPSDTLGIAETMRGSSDILAMCDAHMAIVPVERNMVAIVQTKQREDEIVEPFKVEIRGNEERTSLEFMYAGKFDEDENKQVKCTEACMTEMSDHPGEKFDVDHFLGLFHGLFGESLIRRSLKSLEKLNIIQSTTKRELGIGETTQEGNKRVYFSKKGGEF